MIYDSNCEAQVVILQECSIITFPSLHSQVQSNVSAMLQLRDAKASSVSKPISLFMDDGQPVYLVVQCIRVPKMCNQHFRL